MKSRKVVLGVIAFAAGFEYFFLRSDKMPEESLRVTLG